MKKLGKIRQNKEHLPGITIPDSIRIEYNIANTLALSDIIVLAIISQKTRLIIKKFAPFFPKSAIFVNVSKGIERKSLKTLSQVFKEEVPKLIRNYCVLSGPSHAEEVIKNVPTAVVVASKSRKIAKTIQNLFITRNFRVYTSNDVVGVELGSALKNVIAVAAGIVDGIGLGSNTKAALITRGLAEITRFAKAKGGKIITITGLSGLGDLIVTCNSKYSRNRFVGEQIGKGSKLIDILNSRKDFVEGIPTTKAVYLLSKKSNISMPITEQIYNVIFKEKSPILAIKDLMTRAGKAENT